MNSCVSVACNSNDTEQLCILKILSITNSIINREHIMRKKPFYINEANVDKYIEHLIEKNNGDYITQGVAFNKYSAKEIGLLRSALIYSKTFSSLTKQLISEMNKDDKTIFKKNYRFLNECDYVFKYKEDIQLYEVKTQLGAEVSSEELELLIDTMIKTLKYQKDIEKKSLKKTKRVTSEI